MALRRLSEHHPDFRWECVGRSEIDKYAIAAADAIFPENKDKNFGDISKIDWAQVPDFDLFTYSFPCTDISSAGLQRGMSQGSGTASSLLWECERAIEIKRPKYLLMENVKALTQEKFRGLFAQWRMIVEGYGYTNYWKILNACDFGVEQNRERVFMLSIRGEHKPYAFPKPIASTRAVEDYFDDDVDESFFFAREVVKDEHWHNILKQPRVRRMVVDCYRELCAPR